jgi:streptomycin 6-kinase
LTTALEPSTQTATRSTLDQSLVDAAAAEIAAELAATQYQRNAHLSIPALATLADALYWNSTGDSTKLDEYYAACAAVKAKYPKGGDS